MTKNFTLESEQMGVNSERGEATNALLRQFDDFKKMQQLAVVESLREIARFKAGHTLEKALNESSDSLDDEAKIREATSQPPEWHNLTLLSNQENGLVGRTLTVKEVLKILEKEIQK